MCLIFSGAGDPASIARKKGLSILFTPHVDSTDRSVTVPGAQPVVPAVFAAVAVGFHTHAALGRQWML